MTTTKLRIGSVPYLNAKPLVDWFHSDDCDVHAEIIYAVPSKLARMLRDDEIDVANVSIFEGLQNPDLVLIPNISISADGAVKSVRLFHKKPLGRLRDVALDISSLTSAALTKILLSQVHGANPEFVSQSPDYETMLDQHDACLIIGDLKLFDLHHGEVSVYDLGQGWKDWTGLPFVYAAWLARKDRYSPELESALVRAKAWGTARLSELAETWAERLNLPLDRSLDYLLNVMDYDLDSRQLQGLERYRLECLKAGLISEAFPLRVAAD